MFGEEDDGDLDFAPSKDLSRLASIFRSDDQSNVSGSKSLAYTAPKQKMTQSSDLRMSDDSSSNVTKTDQNSAVVMAFAVHLFILVNNQYASQGKVGAALAQNKKSNSSQIVLYRDKQKPLALVDIGPDFTFTLQNGMYGNFEDSRNCHYSLRFDSESIAAKFASQVEAAKEQLKPSTAAAIAPAPTPEPAPSGSPVVSEPSETACPAPSSSVNEVTDKKTSLINRMARMGQPILPMLCRSPSQEAESIADVREAFSLESPLPVEMVTAKPSQRVELAVSNHTAVWPVPHVPRSEIISLDTLLRDNQGHFAEVKADSSRFMDKLDQLVVKVDTLQQQQILQQQTLQLQFLQNMQQSQTQMCLQPQQAAPKVITGDSRLEEYLKSTESLKLTVEHQLEAVYKLIESNSREQIESSVDPEAIQCLREEKAQLAIRLNETLEEKEEKEESHQKVLSQCQTLVVEKEEHLRQLQEAQELSRKLQNELDTLQSGSQHQDQETNTETPQIEDYEKIIEELKGKLDQSTIDEQSRISSQVQRIMNTVYRQLLHSFSPDETYAYADIKTTLSSVIREVTSSLLSENNAQAQAGKPDLPPPPVFSSHNEE